MQNINKWGFTQAGGSVKGGFEKEGSEKGGLQGEGFKQEGLQGVIEKTRLILQHTIIVLFLLLLSGCGASNLASPQIKVQPVTKYVTGEAALGLINNADITAYAVTPENNHCAYNSLSVVGEGKSNAQGNYNITFNADAEFILLRLTGGSYVEEASGITVPLLPGQSLYALGKVGINDSLKPTIISALSSIHTGLFCYLIEQTDNSLAKAHMAANEFITAYIGFDPRYVDYKDPTLVSNNDASIPMDDGMLLGILNAGISQHSYDLASHAEIGTVAYSPINSIYMVQHFYSDIYQDGMLDGRGLNGRIFIGQNLYSKPLTPATYKFDLPRATLKFYDSNANNKIRQNRAVIYKMADSMNAIIDTKVFPDEGEQLLLDSEAPKVLWLSRKTLSGIHNITLQATDLTSVENLMLLGQDAPAIKHVQGNMHLTTIDSANYSSGAHTLSIVATDTLGNQATYSFPVVMINDAPTISVESQDVTKDQKFDFKFNIGKVHAQQNIDYNNSYCAVASSQVPIPALYDIVPQGESFLCEVDLRQDINNIQVVVCDTNSLCNEDNAGNMASSHAVKYDIQPPVIGRIDLIQGYRCNISFRIDVTDAL
ncbi:MAG: hypothetical protein HAW61_06060, partial [Candidatus Portiera sp.]|nr:hypothetical protein [Portiera sp.]